MQIQLFTLQTEIENKIMLLEKQGIQGVRIKKLESARGIVIEYTRLYAEKMLYDSDVTKLVEHFRKKFKL